MTFVHYQTFNLPDKASLGSFPSRRQLEKTGSSRNGQGANLSISILVRPDGIPPGFAQARLIFGRQRRGPALRDEVRPCLGY
jgi:hypothetical protein